MNRQSTRKHAAARKGLSRRQALVAITVFALLGAFALGAWFYDTRAKEAAAQRASETRDAFNRPGMPSMGPLMAKVQIMEFFDPACESCRAFYPYVKEIMAKHEGSTRLSLRYANFHDGSEYVSKALEAIRLQGPDVYWRAVEAVLAAQPVWADHGRPQPERIWDFLPRVGVDVERARRDMNDPDIAARLKQDAEDIVALGVRQTPTFFINGKPLRNFGRDGLAAQVAEEAARTAR
ncbi:MAG: thioredoxin domain-containing protein [Moraxellaceae bacterium]|nr:thioredoxin domain-containing protein [Moraxellaceae bacterium]